MSFFLDFLAMNSLIVVLFPLFTLKMAECGPKDFIVDTLEGKFQIEVKDFKALIGRTVFRCLIHFKIKTYISLE